MIWETETINVNNINSLEELNENPCTKNRNQSICTATTNKMISLILTWLLIDLALLKVTNQDV